MRVLFVASALRRGGAERQLVVLASELRRRGHDVRIACLRGPGPLDEVAGSAGVDVVHVSDGSRAGWARARVRLVRLIRRWRPDVVHPYLTAPCVTVTLLRPLLGGATIVWGIRSSEVRGALYGPKARLVLRLAVLLSRYADHVILNSECGRRSHLEAGYPAERMTVIPNGIDTDRFRPDTSMRTTSRQLMGVTDEHFVVGMVGRADPVKGHDVFVRAVAIACETLDDVAARVVGAVEPDRRVALEAAVADSSVAGRLRFVEPTDAPEMFYNGFDVLVFPSFEGEGFPNVVAEGLATGLRVVATDVGDVAAMMGSLGAVVPAGDADRLAQAVVDAARDPHDPAAARRRVLEHYSIDQLGSRTEALLLTFCTRTGDR